MSSLLAFGGLLVSHDPFSARSHLESDTRAWMKVRRRYHSFCDSTSDKFSAMLADTDDGGLVVEKTVLLELEITIVQLYVIVIALVITTATTTKKGGRLRHHFSKRIVPKLEIGETQLCTSILRRK